MIKSLFSKPKPKLKTAGLWINDGWANYYNLGRSQRASLRLPPGVVSGGRVGIQASLTEALIELRKKSGGSSVKKGVVLTIPIVGVRIQPFTVPVGSFVGSGDPVELGIRMAAPVDVDSAYYGWKKISERGDGLAEMIGVFAEKGAVDGLATSAENAGYRVAAVEFGSLSLSRAALEEGVADREKPTLFLETAPEGVNFFVSYQGHPFLHQSMAWDVFRSGVRRIAAEDFKEALTGEVRKIAHLYAARYKTGGIRDAVLIAPHYGREIEQAIQEAFPELSVRIADPGRVNPAIGAAFRGLNPYSADLSINLANR